VGVRIRILITLYFFSPLAAAQAPDLTRCTDLPVYSLLDFWVGEWEVFSDDAKVGSNRIEKVLNGCAIIENWTADDGGEGKSLFYVDADGVWQQVWVTEFSANPGGMKEKTRVASPGDDSVRFQGELKHQKRGSYLDRTTLTSLGNGDVRQHIEVSFDGGENWRTTFDAVYRRVSGDSQ
jgi:hypothetical protein